MAQTSKSLFAICQCGSAAIEYALVLPALLLFLLGIMDTGRLLWTYTTLYRASEAAARCAAIQATRCTTSIDIQNYAVAQAWGLIVDASTFAVSNQTCGMQVTASYNFTFVIPWLELASSGNSNSITLTAKACYPV